MLRRLVRSLDVEAASASFELIVVDQSDDSSARSVLESDQHRFAWSVHTSPRGVSRGRNAGLVLARAPIVVFPDDDAWFPGNALRRVADRLLVEPRLAGVSAILRDVEGRPNLLRWAREPGPVTLANYYRTSIGSTVFFRTDVARALGGFEELVGPGSGTDIGSCEDADFVIRALEHGPIAYDPTIAVHHDHMVATLEASLTDKMRAYGVGQAWFWRRHRYPPWHVVYLLFRKVVKVALSGLRGRWADTANDRAFVAGALRGLADRDILRRAQAGSVVPSPR